MAVVTSYSTLKTAVTEWLARSDLTGFVDNFIQNFESRFYRQPDNWGAWMEVSLSGTIAASVLALPADYRGLKYAYVSGSPSSRLDYASINQLYGRYPRGDGTGTPVWLSREAGNFVFGPEPDSAYTIKGVYYGRPVSVVSSPDDAVAHWMVTDAPDILLYGALLEAEPFMKNDSRLSTWQAFLDRAVQDYRDMIRREDTYLVQDVLA